MMMTMVRLFGGNCIPTVSCIQTCTKVLGYESTQDFKNVFEHVWINIDDKNDVLYPMILDTILASKLSAL